ncbi:MAG: diaminopimelate epimerase [Ignavibacteria bacterium]|nr:diaminopimelate epimerase [Ignavibacteria bacterium]
MRQYYFTKLSGAGNDFILFDLKLNPELDLNSPFISKICDRRNGIGADGVILFDDSNDLGFTMKYYNADGSTGSLCANGARCSLYYAYKTNRIDNNNVQFLSNGIQYHGKVLNDELIQFFLKEPENLKTNFKIKAAGQLIAASFVNTGSPHVVIKIKDVLKVPNQINSNTFSLDEFPVYEIGKEIRYSKDFAPEGTNVNFIELRGDLIKIRSYERGVENETLACGTGSVASAIISFIQDKMKPPIKLVAKSGDELIVDFKVEDNRFMNLSLTGPAKIIFKGEITI